MAARHGMKWEDDKNKRSYFSILHAHDAVPQQGEYQKQSIFRTVTGLDLLRRLCQIVDQEVFARVCECLVS